MAQPKSTTCATTWALRDAAGRTLASGQLPPAKVPTGGLTALGAIRLELRAIRRRRVTRSRSRLALSSTIGTSGCIRRSFPSPSSKIVVVTRWDDTTRKQLAAGRTVVLLLDPQQAARTTPTTFTTSFWANSWFPDRHETMGVLCQPSHRALVDFPTATHADWQWWDLMSGSRAFVLNGAPAGLPASRAGDRRCCA